MKIVNILLKNVINKLKYFLIVTLFVFTGFNKANAQEELITKKDSIKEWQLKLNPKLSPLLSAAVPGLGQIYNRKIWKVPIIYGGFYGLLYSWNYNQERYRKFYYASVAFPDKLENRGYPFNDRIYTREQLTKSATFYKRYRNLSMIGLIGWYALNIIDAGIDANAIKLDMFAEEKTHSPQRAAVLSAAIPGLGQIYNRKLAWLKVPVIYGGFVGFYIAWKYNDSYYTLFNDVYKNIPANAPIDSIYSIEGYYYVKENVYKAQEYYRRWKDLSLIFIGLIYVLNIIDATVSGYMLHYDISNDLSFNIQPDFIDLNSRFYGHQPPIGLKLTFKF